METVAGGPEGQEHAMQELLAKFDDAYFNQDVDALRKLLAHDALLHADKLAVENDCHGAEEVARCFAKYFTNYKFKHFPVVRAVDVKSRSVFSLWDDEDVIMKPEKFDEQLPASGSLTSISGIWKLVLSPDSKKVQEIWSLRQLTREEKKHRLKVRPNMMYSDFKAKELVGPTADLSDKQLAKMQAAAEAFNQAWSTGDVKPVHDLLAPGAHTISPIFGERRASREEWEEVVKDVHQFWEVKESSADIAVTPQSNKAFIHWRVRGVQKDTQQENEMWGLNLLVFDLHEVVVSEVVGFRLPLASEHDHIVKAGPYQDTLPEK